MGIRRAGFIALALAAVVVVAIAGPTTPPPPDATPFEELVQRALDDFDANEGRTEGAPQQQVVNGWVNRDLLTIISAQLSAGLEANVPDPADSRVPLLLVLLVFAVAWHGATMSPTASNREVDRHPPPAPSPPEDPRRATPSPQ